ncbi:cadherin domain-containing protein, partial [Vibrio ouci]
MNAKSLAPLLLSNTTVVIDVNGQVRQLLPGEVPGPGEVIVVVGQGATAATEEAPADFGFEAQLVGESGDNFALDLDNEIASIIEQIEDGVDPTQNEDFATAAGGESGSSLTGSGDIERTGAETLAETEFDTSGLESQGLSETQSLALLEVIAQTVFVGDDDLQAFETDVPLILNGSVEAIDTDTPTFIVQDSVAGDYGTFFLNSDGSWTYVADSAYDELNVGDSLVDVFPIESVDGTVGSVTVTINGTNDLPQFVATEDFVPGGGEGELSNFAFEDGVYSFEFAENSDPGTIVGQVSATDPDNQVLSFSISTNVENEGGEALFAIDSETGEISLTAAGAASFANDFEALTNVHNLVVTVTEDDGIGEPQSVDVDVILTETNVDEPPVFEPPAGGGDDYVFAYPENSEAGAVVGSVSASDPEDTIVSYSLDFTNDPTLAGLFSIDSDGTIRLTEAGAATFTNDFEWGDDNTHGITVVATDETGQSTEIDVVLNEDVNEAPTSNEPDGGYVFEYQENSDTETLLGTVSASDVDDGDTLTYSITTNVEVDGLPLYRIDDTSGEIYLTDKGVEVFTNDFETDPNLHNIVVTATDSGGLTATINVNLQETDVNEAPTSNEPDGGYVFEYQENSDTETLLGTVSASDVDDGDTLTYSITTNVEVDGLPLYRIDDTSGEIYLTDKGVEVFTNDFETDPNLHNIVVTATDSGGLTTPINVNLQETDVNEAPTSNEPDGGYVFEYQENSDTETLLGTVSASDVDDGDTLTYSITTN